MKKILLMSTLLALLAGCSEENAKPEPPPPPYTDEMVMDQLSKAKSVKIYENQSGDSVEVYLNEKTNRNMFQGDSNLRHSEYELITRNGKPMVTLEETSRFHGFGKTVKFVDEKHQTLGYAYADSPKLVHSSEITIYDSKEKKVGYIEARNERSFDEFTYYDAKTKKKVYTYDGDTLTFYGGDNMLRMQSFLLVSYFRFSVFDEINNDLE